VPVVKMTKKELDADQGAVMQALESALWVILDRHRGENVLLHTVSYKLSEMVEEIVREWCEAQWDMHQTRVPLHTYRAASDRDHALDRFKQEGGVLIGPSLDRGVDLPGDLCRVQVVVKVPFPNLGDKVIATRMRNAGGLNARGEQMTGGQRWYATETARVIVQMTGRGVRSATDWCTTYVLDKAFLEWYNRDGKALLPKWWRDAMKMELVRDYQ
jgi:Rad3-related DNA helicase